MTIRKIHTKDTWHYGAVQGTYFIAFCGLVSCLTIFLVEKGFSAGEAGILLALSNVLSMFTQPLLADFIDRHESVQLKHVLALLSLVSFGFLFALIFAEGRTLVYGLYLAVCVVQITMQPFVNTLGVGYHHQGYQLDFGVSRGMGSLSFSLTSLIIGQLAVLLGGMSVIYVSLTGVALLFFVVLTFRRNENTALHAKTVSSSLSTFARNNQRYIVLLLGMTLVMSSQMIISTFMLQIMENMHAGSQEMGIAFFIMGVVEIPTMFLFSKINRKFKSSSILIFSTVFFVVRIALLSMATQVLQVYGIQSLQALAYAMFLPAMVQYTQNVIDKKDSAKGQSCVGMVMSAAGVVGGFVGGIVLDAFGIQALLILGIGMAVIGALIAFVVVDKKAR